MYVRWKIISRDKKRKRKNRRFAERYCGGSIVGQQATVRMMRDQSH